MSGFPLTESQVLSLKAAGDVLVQAQGMFARAQAEVQRRIEVVAREHGVDEGQKVRVSEVDGKVMLVVDLPEAKVEP